MEISVKGQKFLVTGAGSGIGQACVKTLHKGGALVYALARNPTQLDSLVKECPGVIPVLADLADWNAVEKAVNDIEPLDGLVNSGSYDALGQALESTKEDLDRAFAVNVRALSQIIQIVTKKMIQAKKQGSIVNLSAMLHGFEFMSPLIVTKAAIDELTRHLALDLGPYGIRVNCVSPSFILTDAFLAYSKTAAGAARAETQLKRIPLGRFCEVEDVVNAVLFFLSDKSRMSTGSVFLTDGGFSAT